MEDDAKPIDLWDGQEPITDALQRFSLNDQFDLAIAAGNRDAALSFLLAVGTDVETAAGIIAKILPSAQ